MRRVPLLMALAALLAAGATPSIAQSTQPGPVTQNSQDDSLPASAAGSEGTAIAPPFAVAPGTRFLIALEDSLSTKNDKAGRKFKARTLEALATPGGLTIPAGALVRGHIGKTEPAGQMGRARLWLTFDTIDTPSGRVPLVADISDTPGEHAIRAGTNREGAIEARTDKRQQEAEAVAGSAFVGAAPGVVTHNPREAAIGAAVGAATAYMAAAAIGQDITLPKDTKLELTLDRALYLGRT